MKLISFSEKHGDIQCGGHAGLVTVSTISTKTGAKMTLCCKFTPHSK